MANAFSFSGVKEPTIEYKDTAGKDVSKPLWEVFSKVQEQLKAATEQNSDELLAVKSAVAAALDLPDITFQQAIAFQAYLMERIQEVDEVKKISRLNASFAPTASNRQT